MCGISFILSSSEDVIKKDELLSSLLNYRGPDYSSSQYVQLDEQLSCVFRGSVLWMQGDSLEGQPVCNESGDIFLWNGDQFNKKESNVESDTISLFRKLERKSGEEFVSVLSTVEGPWSFIYYDNCQKKIYFGRDIFGRHSLLWSGLLGNGQGFILTSVGRRQDYLKEVPALGIYEAKIDSLNNIEKKISLYPFSHVTAEQLLIEDLINVKIFNSKVTHGIKVPLCKDIPSSSVIEELKSFSPVLDDQNLPLLSNYMSSEISLFNKAFEKSIEKRIKACPNKCINCTKSVEVCRHSKYAVLFSGGLDSALIALYVNKCLPENESIDLLNVSFENQRHRVSNSKKRSQNVEVITDFNSPDRLSGLACLKELEKINCKRKWNFVEIDISCEELKAERSNIISHLIAPHSSVLDDSIGCALYFCGRGIGRLRNSLYTSPARVVFSGLGADEQLAGYSRHRAKFNEFGWEGLLKEINLEVTRIHQRNCGRDDRVLSHHGRTTRFPYLDEGVVTCLNSFPIWKKANLYLPRGIGEKILLRTIAAKESLFTASKLPKRAIQFGSRIAKLENSKEKGNDLCERIQEFRV
ncbi:UNVERIFIED_CONTAM: hypothetical protein RMT77_005441 [Armadillidium vulgare]